MWEFEGSCKKFVVSYDNLTMVNSPYTIEQDLKIYGHEEADTLIPLHVIYCLRENTFRVIHVRSPDTDVFILLIDLISNNHLGTLTELILFTRTGAKYREIDLKSCVQVIGRRNPRASYAFTTFLELTGEENLSVFRKRHGLMHIYLLKIIVLSRNASVILAKEHYRHQN